MSLRQVGQFERHCNSRRHQPGQKIEGLAKDSSELGVAFALALAPVTTVLRTVLKTVHIYIVAPTRIRYS